MNSGILYALGAYIAWGLLPIYWKSIQNVPALEILGHRIIWSVVFVGMLLYWQKDRSWIETLRGNRKLMGTLVLTALLLSNNWFFYIWAVNQGFVVETALGYFINPLISVVLGVLFFGETLRVWQWMAVAVACVGVLYLTFVYGQLPWIALILAFSFAFYGLLRKKARLASIPALGFETAVIVPIALIYIIVLEASGSGHLFSVNWQTTTLLLLAGVITAVPLLLFGAGANRINLSTIGILQYIAPTMQFFIGIYLYNEPFTQTRLIGFCIIWLALVVYAVDGLKNGRRQPKPVVAATD